MGLRSTVLRFALVLLLALLAVVSINGSQAQASYTDFQLVAVEPSQAMVSGVDLSLLTVSGGALDYSTEFERGSAKWKARMTGYVSGDRLVGSLYVEIRIVGENKHEVYSIEETEFMSTTLPISEGTVDIILGRFTERTNATSSGEEITRQGESGQRISYRVSRPGGPLVPPGKVAKVLYAGNTSRVGWPLTGGGFDWRPLFQGDALVPGCIILIGGEGDPQSGGGRVKLAFSDTFSYVVEPYSRVIVFEGGLRVESGSVEACDQSPIENFNTYGDNGFCSGKDTGAAQPPFTAQAFSPAFPLTSAAAVGSRYRFEILSDGTARVSVFEGVAEVRSAATQATTLLRAGQQVTLTPQGLGPLSEKSFTDVSPTNPYHTAIIGMAVKEIVNGYKKGDLWEFRPGDPVKRAQFAKMIVGAMRIAPKADTGSRFTDLGSPDAAGYPHVFVQAAYENKITTGTNTDQTLFAPWDPIKRAQVVTMIVRAANSLWPEVLATPPAGWSGQMSSFSEPTHGANMRLAEYNNLLAGLEGFGRTWDPWKQATRGEVAQMLWNLMTR